LNPIYDYHQNVLMSKRQIGSNSKASGLYSECIGFESLPIYQLSSLKFSSFSKVRTVKCWDSNLMRSQPLPWSYLLTYLLTYGAEPFLRSHQLCSHSRTSQHFMEPEGCLPNQYSTFILSLDIMYTKPTIVSLNIN
jgi:hypothetical protein